MAGILAICSLVPEAQVIPWAFGNIERAMALAAEDIFLDTLRSRHHYVDHSRGITIAVEGVEGTTLLQPIFQYGPNGHDPYTVLAREGSVKFDLEKRVVNLHLRDVHVSSPNQQTSFSPEENFPFDMPPNNKRTNPRYQSIHENRRSLGELVQGLENSRHERDVETALALAIGDFDHLAHPDPH